MAFQPINKPVPKYYNGKKVFGRERDCKDFKPYFFNRKYCKLSDKCEKKGYGCVFPYTMQNCANSDLYNDLLCTGIDRDRWQEIMS